MLVFVFLEALSAAYSMIYMVYCLRHKRFLSALGGGLLAVSPIALGVLLMVYSI